VDEDVLGIREIIKPIIGKDPPFEVKLFIRMNAPRIRRLMGFDVHDAVLWFFTENMAFGWKEPVDLIMAGQTKILQEFIDDAMKQLDDPARIEDERRVYAELDRQKAERRAKREALSR
jgi:hypothetical protein